MEQLRGMEWVAWKRSEQTQAFLSHLRQSVSAIQADWLNNAYMADGEFQTLMLNAGALGAARQIESIIAAIENIQDFNEGESDEQ